MKKYYVCLLTGEVIKAWTKSGARKYFQNNYPCKTPYKMKMRDVMELGKYNKIYGENY
jgi:hypothetical protein